MIDEDQVDAPEGEDAFEEIVPPLAPAPALAADAVVTPPPARVPVVVLTLIDVNGEQRTTGAVVELTAPEADAAIADGRVRAATATDLRIAGAAQTYAV